LCSKALRRSIGFSTLDALVLLLVAATGAYLVYRVHTGVHYRWNWSVIPQYFWRFDPQRDAWVSNLLMQGFFTTLRLSIWATLLGSFLGAGAGLFRVSGSLFKRLTGGGYVECVRNLPPLVLIFIFYYFVSNQIMPALHVDEFARSRSGAVRGVMTLCFAPPERFAAFASAVITLALYEGAYITEIVRAGIQSIEKGQWEAAASLGMPWWTQMRHVILPQAVQRIVPPLAGQFISSIKDSAIVSVISIEDLTFQGMELMAATYLTFEVWITITAMYLVLTLTCSLAARRIESRLRRGLS